VLTPRKKIAIRYRARDAVALVLPEKLDASQLAQRLKDAGGSEKVAPDFLGVDWLAESKAGDAVAGRKLFGTLGCVKCHAISADQKAGGGPSLTDARKRFTVPFLVESILLPSKQIAEPFRATTLTTKQGLVVAGLIVNESAESIELLLPDATRRTLAKRDIDERAAAPVSPMPAGIVRTRQELLDLLAYLLSENPSPP
jgi:putative heme-binding domain-containing protein